MNPSYTLRNKRVWVAGHRGLVGSALIGYGVAHIRTEQIKFARAGVTLSSLRRTLTKRALKAAHGTVTVNGTLTGAVGGEQIVVSRRNLSSGSWQHQVVVAGANGGSFTTSWRMAGPSLFVAQWAGDSGRPGLGSKVLRIAVR